MLPAIVAIAAVDAALLIYAGTVMGVSGQLRSSALGVVGGLFTAMGAVLPNAFVGGVDAIVGFLGVGWWQRSLIEPAFAGDSSRGLPALGGALAAPVYAFVRWASGTHVRSKPIPAGPPPHRIYVPRIAQSLEQSKTAKGAVQAGQAAEVHIATVVSEEKASSLPSRAHSGRCIRETDVPS